jgi:aryl-alcohol dehydrogenase-like predicted oxidoreductase
MEYRSLGRTGTKVSELCLGCMMFGGSTGAEESFDIIDRAIDAGINFLDTANVYSRGKSEEVVGKALQRNGKRDRIVLATKVFGTMDDDDPNMQGPQRRHIIQQCEASLRRLQTDYIDLYQIHRPTSDIPIDETLRALDDLVRSGKVRYIGTSTFEAWQFMESLWVAKEYGLNRFISEQPPYHILDRRIERGLVPLAQSYGVALLPWSPLAGGFLTGKYQRNQDKPAEARFSKPDNEWADKHFTPAAFDVVELLEEIAQDMGKTVSQVALAWCNTQPGITSPIIGPRTMQQFEDNLGAVGVQLSEEHLKRIDALAPPGDKVVTYYDADYGPAKYRW